MESVAALAFARQRRLVAVANIARTRALNAWQGMDFQNLDASWERIAPTISQQVSHAQLTMAHASDTYTKQAAKSYDFTPDRSAIVPEAFTGIDDAGREVGGILRGAVTTTKEAVGAGFGSAQSLQAGANYLAAIMKTLIGDLSRSADLVSSAGKGYTHYIRVVGGSGCSRCAILAGISSAEEAFKRHVSCQCCTAPVYTAGKELKAPAGMYSNPQEYFESLSAAEQDRAFTKAGAEAIRSGADVSKVVSARRGAKGIGYYSHEGLATKGSPRGHFVKTTIGVRPNGTPVRVYTTTEGATVRGQFGKTQRNLSDAQRLAGSRYATTTRVRLMPETIMEIAGNDLQLRQAFLRDAGYLEYMPPHGYDAAGKWIHEIEQMRLSDRRLVNAATLRYGNFTLG